MFRLGVRSRAGLKTPRASLPLALMPLAFNVTHMPMRSSLGCVRYSSSGSEIKAKLTDFSQEVTDDLTKLADALPGAANNVVHPDSVGYMASIGLGDGWGPTASITNLLELAHVYTGLPWWGTIVCVTVCVRAVMFPIYIKSLANMAKMSGIKPQIDALMEDIKNGDNEDRVVAMKKRSRLYKEHDIHTAHSFLPLLQLPVAYGFFQATRNMAHYPVPGFDTQGAFWFPDLTQVDPYIGLQVLTALVVTGMMRAGGETGAQAMNPMFKRLMSVLPFLSIFVTYNMSAAVLVYFAANSVFSFAQSLVLKNKYFRRWAKIPAIVKPVPVAGAKPPPATMGEWFKDFNTKIKDQTHTKMEKTNKKLEAMEKRKAESNKGFIKRH